MFLLTFFGFGVKAGLAPVNSWLPRAYRAAPRAFAPVLAGATLNLGLHGILRVNAECCRSPSRFGPSRTHHRHCFGAARDTLRDHQNDLKAMLAHCSIENVGIVVAGYGAGMVFVARIIQPSRPWHSSRRWISDRSFAVQNAVVFRRWRCGDADRHPGYGRLGGLIKWMPLTALGFLAGTLSIAALPPFNGFASDGSRYR